MQGQCDKDQCPALCDSSSRTNVLLYFYLILIIKNQCPVLPLLIACVNRPALWFATSQCLALQLCWYRHLVTRTCYSIVLIPVRFKIYQTLAALLKCRYISMWFYPIGNLIFGIVIRIPQDIGLHLSKPYFILSILKLAHPVWIQPLNYVFDSSRRMSTFNHFFESFVWLIPQDVNIYLNLFQHQFIPQDVDSHLNPSHNGAMPPSSIAPAHFNIISFFNGFSQWSNVGDVNPACE